ncbi:uncharacterized protein UTRI_05350 [Ustilago trichophora]|uniref:Uncharacterized protein n=1 Tax=Ustilago trichophora TaxID=86804 RepID=A0A5C3EJD6_9BASI|nr:uncharacterized protein UTRI_05350 [Ustilago trichophora]
MDDSEGSVGSFGKGGQGVRRLIDHAASQTHMRTHGNTGRASGPPRSGPIHTWFVPPPVDALSYCHPLQDTVYCRCFPDPSLLSCCSFLTRHVDSKRNEVAISGLHRDNVVSIPGNAINDRW